MEEQKDFIARPVSGSQPPYQRKLILSILKKKISSSTRHYFRLTNFSFIANIYFNTIYLHSFSSSYHIRFGFILSPLFFSLVQKYYLFYFIYLLYFTLFYFKSKHPYVLFN
ncbi:hypothetical protein GLOIN_2v1569083 [Rhizophagus irregularis DAOM 181602=DAOM 197198]|uniref:Transmembrane protein n=3 Tax=Rhizophagus irregularis TaxID=588596 RepID=A0A015K6Y3_RHIIW|nr:hypothetical protein GLOIN_2v1569083 [Rhizophagus irregularis DAOM 181602=DAOM 197198]EXX55171.1 hypothetical protein RirG_227750 [Rhizophagus irregularis DAOM 197198w]POG75159.1 hypothetical protein GLOIN_2v1569083 [Rhizophagus irregularis DAOM 181602=DAOM 197198]|eukprot:XP_025182025.1 hypothetical protein GLOIN_2v1569083 [Rhizophagus irregularis DAOM 181602=DAOM 197198]